MKAPASATETSAFLTWMGEDGICRTTIKKKNSVIELKEAKENSRAVNDLFTGKKFPLMIDARNVKSMSREAREFLSTKGRETHTNAFGIIVSSTVSRVIGNFFMSINKTPIPTRLFNDESSAAKWLHKFVIR
jgi:hypothetical protein